MIGDKGSCCPELSGGSTELTSPASMIPGAQYTEVGWRGGEASRWGRLARKPHSQRRRTEEGLPGWRQSRDEGKQGEQKSSGQRRC